MSAMMSFVTWFIDQLPSFLLAEPISAFTGIAVSCFVVQLISRLISVGRR